MKSVSIRKVANGYYVIVIGQYEMSEEPIYVFESFSSLFLWLRENIGN